MTTDQTEDMQTTVDIKNEKKLFWYEKLIRISESVLKLESYYKNFRDAQQTVDRLIELKRLTRTRSQHPFQ